MARKKDKAIAVVITDLTPRQAADLAGRISVAKEKIAPNARGTCAIRDKKGIGQLLQRQTKRISD